MPYSSRPRTMQAPLEWQVQEIPLLGKFDESASNLAVDPKSFAEYKNVDFSRSANGILRRAPFDAVANQFTSLQPLCMFEQGGNQCAVGSNGTNTVFSRGGPNLVRMVCSEEPIRGGGDAFFVDRYTSGTSTWTAVVGGYNPISGTATAYFYCTNSSGVVTEEEQYTITGLSYVGNGELWDIDFVFVNYTTGTDFPMLLYTGKTGGNAHVKSCSRDGSVDLLEIYSSDGVQRPRFDACMHRDVLYIAAMANASESDVQIYSVTSPGSAIAISGYGFFETVHSRTIGTTETGFAMGGIRIMSHGIDPSDDSELLVLFHGNFPGYVFPHTVEKGVFASVYGVIGEMGATWSTENDYDLEAYNEISAGSRFSAVRYHDFDDSIKILIGLSDVEPVTSGKDKYSVMFNWDSSTGFSQLDVENTYDAAFTGDGFCTKDLLQSAAAADIGQAMFFMNTSNGLLLCNIQASEDTSGTSFYAIVPHAVFNHNTAQKKHGVRTPNVTYSGGIASAMTMLVAGSPALSVGGTFGGVVPISSLTTANATYIAAGMMLESDGFGICESGLTSPPVLLLGSFNSGGGVVEGTYVYSACYVARSSNGDIAYSPMSAPLTAVFEMGASKVLLHYSHPITMRGKKFGTSTNYVSMSIRIYRTVKDLSTLYLLTEQNVNLLQDMGTGPFGVWSYEDSTPDTLTGWSLSAQEQPYTAGGYVESATTIGVSHMGQYSGRMVVCDRLGKLWLSMPKTFGESPRFSVYNRLFPNGVPKGVVESNGRLLCCYSDRVTSFAGEAGDEFGNGPRMAEEQIYQSGVGISDSRLLVDCRGQIALGNANTNTINLFSPNGTVDITALASETWDSVTALRGMFYDRIKGALICDVEYGGYSKLFLYFLDLGAWSMWDPHWTVSSVGSLLSSAYLLPIRTSSGFYVGTSKSTVGSGLSVLKENLSAANGSWLDLNTQTDKVAYSMQVTSPWFRAAPYGSRMRVKSVLVGGKTLNYTTGNVIDVKVLLDGRDTSDTTYTTFSKSFVPSAQWTTPQKFLRVYPSPQQCWGVRVVIAENTTTENLCDNSGTEWSHLAFEFGHKQGVVTDRRK